MNAPSRFQCRRAADLSAEWLSRPACSTIPRAILLRKMLLVRYLIPETEIRTGYSERSQTGLNSSGLTSTLSESNLLGFSESTMSEAPAVRMPRRLGWNSPAIRS